MHTKGLFNASQFDLGKVSQASPTSYSLFMLTWWFIFSPKKVKNGAICIRFLQGGINECNFPFLLCIIYQVAFTLLVSFVGFMLVSIYTRTEYKVWHCQVGSWYRREAPQPWGTKEEGIKSCPILWVKTSPKVWRRSRTPEPDLMWNHLWNLGQWMKDTDCVLWKHKDSFLNFTHVTLQNMLHFWICI